MPKLLGGQAAIFKGNDYGKLIASTVGENHKMIFAIAWWTGERMGAICKLPTAAVYGADGKPLAVITYPKRTTKTQTTRQVPCHHTLRELLKTYWKINTPDYNGFLFPGASPDKPIEFQSADDALRRAIKKAGLQNEGYSTHSFRRSLITGLSNRGIALPIIKAITGHKDLKALSRYIEVSDDQIVGAIATL